MLLCDPGSTRWAVTHRPIADGLHAVGNGPLLPSFGPEMDPLPLPGGDWYQMQCTLNGERAQD